MNQKFFNVPNMITLSRLILMPFLFLFVIYDMRILFLITFIVIGSTDFFDGYLARKLNQVTNIGKMLDSIADVFFYIPIAWFLWVLYPDYIKPNLALLIIALSIYTLSMLVALIKFKKPVMMHTALLRFNAVLVFSLVILSYFFITTYFLSIILVLFMIGFIESMLIFIKYGHVDVDTKSIFSLFQNPMKNG